MRQNRFAGTRRQHHRSASTRLGPGPQGFGLVGKGFEFAAPLEVKALPAFCVVLNRSFVQSQTLEQIHILGRRNPETVHPVIPLCQLEPTFCASGGRVQG